MTVFITSLMNLLASGFHCVFCCLIPFFMTLLYGGGLTLYHCQWDASLISLRARLKTAQISYCQNLLLDAHRTNEENESMVRSDCTGTEAK
ncbi:hypothetical protein DEU56DRAFT_40978 [Suillus clintonianus]|uniref:uncharacterized protein n=1 Tax=Suillus clintonianus TaxID=1904413 RepID=UPI001B8792CB|nr:uncharacterized protein DEU56DRAFT_40978 [Suillus clintonianus]KAG2124054.1 hypothetical protein DEU56DRAFT_40978 [Suillus clintonianus]